MQILSTRTESLILNVAKVSNKKEHMCLIYAELNHTTVNKTRRLTNRKTSVYWKIYVY